MKLKYSLGFVLGALLTVGCSDDNTIGTLGEISLSKTYLTIPDKGGNDTVTITAAADWEFKKSVVIGKDADKKDILAELPTWLTASTLSGSAGQTQVIFHADSTGSGHEQVLQIGVGNKTQYLVVRQGSLEAETATCAEVLAGPDGKTYRVGGMVTDIANSTYGNFYINDGTGQVYVYGTLDAEGKEKNFSSLGIEKGDYVTVEGPKTTYGSTVELVNVTVVKISKSLVKVVEAPTDVIPAAGGEYKLKVAYKGSGVYPEIPEAAQSWLHLDKTQFIAGVPSKIEPNPADTVIVTFRATNNTGAARSADVTFTSSTSSNSSSVNVQVSQAGLSGTKAVPFTVEEAIDYVKSLGSSTSATQVYIKGVVSKFVNNGQFGSTYGNGSFWISSDGTYNDDLSKDFEVYRVYWFDNKKWADGNGELAPGAEVVVCATVKAYNGVAETDKGYVYSVNGVTTDANGIGTAATPFNALGAIAAANAGTDANVYVSGKISKVASSFSASYGNASFYMSADGTYANDKAKDFEAFRVLYLGNRKWADGDAQIAVGDQVTIYGPLTVYNGTAETPSGKAYIVNLNGRTE